MESWKADEKQMRWSKVRRKKMQLREGQKKEDTSAPNVREVAKCCVFSMIRVSGESKSRLVKAAGAESCGQRRNQKLHAAVARSTFWSENAKNWGVRSTFWSWDVEKLHAAVARSTFSSENVQNMSGPDHFLKLRCRKIARRCGEKDILKWKCTKHCMFGPLFEVEMLKNCTPLWREAHFQVKMYKTLHSRTTFWSCDVEKLHAAVARSTFPSQNVKKLTVSEHFLKLRFWKIARRCGEKHISKSKCTKNLCFAAFFQVQMSKN